MWLRLCTVKLAKVVNALAQNPQLNVFSLVWLCLCLVKFDELLNDFSQNPQSKGFYPVWLCLCTVKLENVVNAFSHKSHWNIFYQCDFVCMLLNELIEQKTFWLEPQLNGFSQMWIHLWVVYSDDVLNDFSHNSHSIKCSPVWHYLCVVNRDK